MKKTAIAILSIIMIGCSSESDGKIEQAKHEGRKAAFLLVNAHKKEFQDNFELESLIIDAKIKQFQYTENGDTACFTAFDEGFRDYINKNDDRLAKELF